MDVNESRHDCDHSSKDSNQIEQWRSKKITELCVEVVGFCRTILHPNCQGHESAETEQVDKNVPEVERLGVNEPEKVVADDHGEDDRSTHVPHVVN